MSNENSLGISAIEIRLIVKMSGLGKTGLSQHYNKVTEKGSTVDNNGVGSISLGISSLGGIGSCLH